MTAIAIIGAGPGLGLAVARRFGREGHSVAFISRNRTHLDELVNAVSADAVTADGFTADARDAAQLRSALAAAADSLGPIEVLQYSPVPAKSFMHPVLETYPADLAGAIEQSVYGPVTAVQQVLPGMRAFGRGTLLFVNGSSAVRPNPDVAGTSIAFAAESAYAEMLHEVLRPEGIHAAQLIIPQGIGGGDPAHEPDALADRLWRMHRDRGEFRVYAAPSPDTHPPRPSERTHELWQTPSASPARSRL
ncbi:dehydrogenase [Cryobacterium sp. LW097]|uniref:SDR family NAD(P)-dependent oxidoreductase n=1 Tax=Cryobacterium sp. LW097 TaxID=1978566 RepID=UPI000B4CD3BC|nr:SDR family NAD(P)-dependent oxidoreductase [Cryobacterium sp. LW097]ASD22553.1 dehydrogenase [Cryobacterium sp. LW097]